LRLQGNLVRRSSEALPVLFSANELTGRPAEVAHYLMNFSQTGISDIASALRYGAGGVNELMQRQQRLHSSSFVRTMADYVPFDLIISGASGLSWQFPWFAMTLKWLLYLAAGFLLAIGVHFALPAASALERPLLVRGFHFAREILFALGFLLVVLLLSEPFLSQESQRVEFPIRLNLSTVGKLVPVGAASAKTLFMNQLSLLTLLLFFVLQGLIYTACLFKLAEIRRQRVPPRMKLKLLENEDHLFDAGLYLGFVGTIVSLILVSLNIIQFSLMAAYSSTSFGILFVSFFKIFHLRPARRKLILEAEAEREETLGAASPSFATPS
jgi:formate/nitrite transporter FocA (FNT family)